ncbi:hypothetical protein OG607_08250 [Streptomyces sp. NBC_01537]|uniref:hypothetical protein n=1 Tax=Streptomyces sp. NBC_01537 TaxID=2903896 RepID=UPI003865A6DE
MVSLAANIAAAPALAWKPVLVAGRPPVALLLSVELLAHRSSGRVEVAPGSFQDAEGQGDRRHGAARHGDRLAAQKPPKGSGPERLPGREATTSYR